MAKYHINPKTGNPGVCHAKKNCPFGSITSEHYDSVAEAQVSIHAIAEAAVHGS